MWNLNNEYNLPTNQVQRLIDANLNPALMYGSSGNNASGSSSSMAGSPTTTNQFKQTFSPETISSISQLIQASVSSKLGDSQVKNLDLDAYQKLQYNQNVLERYQLEIEGLKNNNSLIDAMTASSLTGITKMQYEMNKLQAETEVLWGEDELQGIDMAIKQSILEQNNQVNYWYGKLQASLIGLQSETASKERAQKDYYEALTKLTESQKWSADIENQIKEMYGMDSAYFENYKKYYDGVSSLINSSRLSFGLGPVSISSPNDFRDYSKNKPQKRHSNSGILGKNGVEFKKSNRNK